VFFEHGLVMDEQRRPLPVTLQLGERTLHEEPFEAPQGTGERFAVDQLQGLAREDGRVLGGEISSGPYECVEVLDVAGDPVGRVETQGRHRVQAASRLIGTQASPNGAGGIGERA